MIIYAVGTCLYLSISTRCTLLLSLFTCPHRGKKYLEGVCYNVLRCVRKPAATVILSSRLCIPSHQIDHSHRTSFALIHRSKRSPPLLCLSPAVVPILKNDMFAPHQAISANTTTIQFLAVNMQTYPSFLLSTCVHSQQLCCFVVLLTLTNTSSLDPGTASPTSLGTS